MLWLLLLQVPNALLAEVKGTAGGCSAISISRDGRCLAAACGDDAGRFKVRGVVLGSVLLMHFLREFQHRSRPLLSDKRFAPTLLCRRQLFCVGHPDKHLDA